MHTYVQTVQSPTCFPGPVQPPQSFNYELDRPGCDTRPLRRDMSFATGVDKVVLTRCVQHLPPYPLTRRPHESTSQDRDQLANARVAEADAPSHHYNRSKPRKLLAIQQKEIIGITSESKGRDI